MKDYLTKVEKYGISEKKGKRMCLEEILEARTSMKYKCFVRRQIYFIKAIGESLGFDFF